MIKSIELWNWESHEHTLIDNLSAGFNLIFGESNAGKTSVIRALKLVAYNDFNQKCIRVGSKTCAVEVKTDKGRVKVSRPDNHWEVQKEGEDTQHYEKIGKVILPEVSEILGMSMVTLGDVAFPVNIMNQLEGHFMLSELDGKTASGSMRAQVIDEISGLAGIEGIIKEVSLDNHRWGREVKQAEDRVEELAAEKHDPELLKEEAELLEKARVHLVANRDCVKAVEQMTNLCNEIVVKGEEAEQVEISLKGLPDNATAKKLLDTAEVALKTAKEAERLVTELTKTAEKVDELTEELKKEVDTDAASKAIDSAAKAFEGAKAVRELNDSVGVTKRHVADAKEKLDNIENETFDAKKELNDILSSIKVCPLTQKPFSGAGGWVAHAAIAETEVPELGPEPEPEDLEEDLEDGLFDGM
jgi:exonuclease SbcC